MPAKLSDNIINQVLKEYYNGLNDIEITNKVGCSLNSVYRIRKKNNLKNNYNFLSMRRSNNCDDTPLTKLQREIICGTLLGDSSFILANKYAKTPYFTVEHSIIQKEYSYLIAEKLNGICKERKRFDKRTNKIYITYITTTKSKLDYIELYNNLYINGKKCITKEFLKDFSVISLCYLFMDDGYTSHNTIFLCTDAFDEQSCDNLIKACEEKFNIHFRKVKHDKNLRLRLIFDDRERFIKLISPYILESMKYKFPKINND